MAEGGSTDRPDDSTSSSTEYSSAPAVPSILEKLKAPRLSDLTRKRKVDTNPPKGKRRARGEGANEPKNISAGQRVGEFPKECLTVSSKKLFCIACREELSLRKNVIVSHVASTKHKNGKERLLLKEAKERDIAEALKVHDETIHPVGETLPEEQRVYRVKVLKTFLRAAIPLTKLEIFRELLEENAYRLSDRRHMSDLVPLIISQEQADVKREISGRPVSIIFDGTTRLGEAMAIIVRFVDDQLVIQQRLIRLQLLTKSMSGEEIARELINTLSVHYSIDSQLVLATMRDRAACNNVAVRTLKIIYPTILDVGCFSHTLDLIGGKFTTPFLTDFTTWWVSLFSHSPKAQFLWKERTGRTVVGYSATRWWSKWEVMKQLMELFGDVAPFLQTNTDLAPATRAKLLSIVNNPQQMSYLQVELAVTVDAGMPFVRATYNLEGDGPLALKCYEEISSLSAAVTQAYYPNLQAVVNRISLGNTHMQQQWTQYAKSCVQPGLAYFTDQLNASMKEPLAAFKAARLFSPSKVHEMQPTSATVDSLVAFPFLSNSVAALKGELPQYVAAAEDVSPTHDPLEFWKEHQDTLPAWSAAAQKVLLVQPSSAASERVFSLLTNSFHERQQSSLQDYIEASLMLQYNKH